LNVQYSFHRILSRLFFLDWTLLSIYCMVYSMLFINTEIWTSNVQYRLYDFSYDASHHFTNPPKSPFVKGKLVLC
jgi:hypothetical protein